MKYCIKISYQTGNSFGSEDTFDYLELEWDNIEVAKENLIRIKEHYKFYRSIERSYSSRADNLKLIKESSVKPWFVNVPKLWCISLDCVIDKNKRKKYIIN